MADTKLAELIINLKSKTEQGTLRWEPTANDNRFQTILAGFVISIELEFDDRQGDTENNFWIRIKNRDGQLIDEASDYDFADVVRDQSIPNFSPFKVMKQLYE